MHFEPKGGNQTTAVNEPADKPADKPADSEAKETGKANILNFRRSFNSGADARYAVKMAGIPVFFTGTSLILSALLFLNAGYSTFGVTGYFTVGVLILTGLVTLLLSFRIRNGNIGSLPFLLTLYFTAFLLNTVFFLTESIKIFQYSALTAIGSLLVGLVLPCLLLTLALTGLRAWLWLRRNGYELRL